MDVKGKVCIITGSAQGLGKEFAKILLDNGAKVCISDLKEESGKLTVDEFEKRYGKENVCFLQCDVTNDEQFEKLFDDTESYFNVNCIDLLVNNAGINTNFGWKKCMEVNILAVMKGTEIAMERMKKTETKGQIINVASMAGFGPGLNAEMVGYTVSKTGVVALTRTMAKDIARHGVTTKCICPAWADTEIVSSVTNKEDLEKHVKKMGGMMTPSHVAEGFYRLVTRCDNGSAMAVLKVVPYFLIPDYNSFPMILSMVMMSKIVDKILAPAVITGKHQILAFIVAFILLALLIVWLF